MDYLGYPVWMSEEFTSRVSVDDPRMDHHIMRKPPRRRKGRKPPSRTDWRKNPPTTLKDLRELGRAKGVEYSSKMTAKELGGLLGTPPIPTKGRSRKKVTITLTDRENGEVLNFPSISAASRFLDVKPGSVSYYVRSGGCLEKGGRAFTMRREELGERKKDKISRN